MILYIVNHVKPNKSTEYIKIIKKKKNETIITILPRRDESQFDENRAPRRRATNGEQRTAMKVTVFGRYLDLEARSTAMEVAWRYFGSHLRPCHPSRRSQSHESPADLSSWWLSLRWVPEGWGAGSSARSGDWPGSAAIAAIAGIAAVAGTWRMECFSPRQRSQARRPVSFCPPVDAPKHRFRKVWRSRNVIFFFLSRKRHSQLSLLYFCRGVLSLLEQLEISMRLLKCRAYLWDILMHVEYRIQLFGRVIDSCVGYFCVL